MTKKERKEETNKQRKKEGKKVNKSLIFMYVFSTWRRISGIYGVDLAIE